MPRMMEKIKAMADNIFKKEEDIFLSHIFSNNIKEAINVGFKLANRKPEYLAYAYLVSLFKTPNDKLAKRMLILSMQKINVNRTCLWLLIKKGLLTEELEQFVIKLEKKDNIYYLILKEFLITNIKNDLLKGSIKENIEMLLDNLDDWDIYNYALENKIELKERDTQNYKYYLLHKYKSNFDGEDSTKKNFILELTQEMISLRTSIKDIEYIIDLCKVEFHENKEYNNLIDLSNNGFSKKNLENCYQAYKENPSVFNIKVLLSSLISSKKTNHIVLAMYISFIHKDLHENNYEIKLVFLFLCRYFCYLPEIYKLIDQMEIKNVQNATLSYIWLDVQLKLKLKNSKYCNKYENYVEQTIKDLKKGIDSYIKIGLISYALEMLELIETFNNDLLIKEIKNQKILGNIKTTSFSLLLGKHSKYIFDKITIEEDCTTPKDVLTIHSPTGNPIALDMLKNDMVKITDKNFLNFYKNLMKYQKSIKK